VRVILARVRLSLLLTTLVLATSPALAAAPGPAPPPTFVSTCTFSHQAPDDPIVAPRRPGVSHDHTFVGNATTNAFSTLRSLRAGNTTCASRMDTAAYWAPTLLVDGTPVIPHGAAAYYRRLTTAPVQAFPAGLRMVGGNPRAWRPQSRRVTFWDCAALKVSFYSTRRTQGQGRQSKGSSASGIPHCSRYAHLQLHVNFPNCWNGKSLDSRDHRSHVAYSVAGKCPASHPVAMPGLSLVYSYQPPGPGTVILSSGGQYSGHADFINSWNQQALEELVATCLNGGAYCLGAGSSSSR
jgi:hypothetical protein